jgi:hypothetical protein
MGKEKIIAVDLDGVIHKYSKGWQDGTIYDPPIKGAKEGLQKLIDHGYKIVIFTTRADAKMVDGQMQPGQYKEVVDYLNKYQIPYTSVYQGVGKPFFKILIDDNCIRFEGDWSDAFIREVLEDINE